MEFIVIVAIILIVIGGFFSSRAAKKRQADLAGLAAMLKLSFSPDKDYSVDERYKFLAQLQQGSDRYAFNIISGRCRGHRVEVFDYHYETESTDSDGSSSTSDWYFSFFILNLDGSFPELKISREGIMSKIAQGLGYDDIDFESHEFSRRFCVRSRDKKFAYDFCNGQMIEYLLANDDLSIEVENDVLAIGFDRQLNAAQIEYNLSRLLQIRSLMPEYLFTA